MMPQPGRQDLQALGSKVLDLLFPPRCVNCKQANGALCPACLASVQPIRTFTCAHCGYPLPTATAPCPECRVRPLTITRIQAAVWHQDALRAAVHALKYYRRRDVAVPLARFLVDRIAQSDAPYDFVTSVPLHPTRELARGYNQAELLAEHAAASCNMKYIRVLERTRETADQIGLDGKARQLNVANAFRANSGLVTCKTILLIDDVTTTGATLEACASALLTAGAHAVYGLAVARPRVTYSI